jgi:hypothetical protein
MALINTKKVEHKVSLDVVDSWPNMETLITKWKHISKVVMANHHKKFKPWFANSSFAKFIFSWVCTM